MSRDDQKISEIIISSLVILVTLLIVLTIINVKMIIELRRRSKMVACLNSNSNFVIKIQGELKNFPNYLYISRTLS